MMWVLVIDTRHGVLCAVTSAEYSSDPLRYRVVS